MTAYRRRPVVVEAIQWTGDNLDEVREWLGEHFGDVRQCESHSRRLYALYRGGGIAGMILGDYIVKPLAPGESCPDWVHPLDLDVQP